MNLPSIIDLTAVAGIGMLAMMIIQYIKDSLPTKLIRWCTLLAGIGVSFLWFYKPGINYDFVVVIANGVLGAIGADTGYNFLSPTNSPSFTLPSKKEDSQPVAQPSK
jgi:hypothetical protein